MCFLVHTVVAALLSAAAVLAHGAGSEVSLHISAQPAWEGLTRPHTPTEFDVELSGNPGGRTMLTARDRNTAVALTHEREVDLLPDGVLNVVMPLTFLASDKVNLHAVRDDGADVQIDIPFRSVPRNKRVVALAGDWHGWRGDSEVSFVFPGAASLPSYAASYATIDVLVIDGTVIPELASQQLSALQGYLSACGRLVVRDIPHEMFAQFQRNAGCSGRFVTSAGNIEQVKVALSRLLSAEPPPLPSPRSLRSMLTPEAGTGDIATIVYFLGGYLCLLVIASFSRLGAVQVLLIPVAATFFGALMWSSTAADHRWLHWVEAEAEEGVARYVSLLRVRGGHRGTADVTVPAQLGPPLPLQAVAMTASLVNAQAETDIVFPTHLLDQHEFAFSGTLRMPGQLKLTIDNSRPRVSNESDSASPSALVAWNGRKYTVPVLAAGARWHPGGEGEPWGKTAAERTFRARAVSDRAALLIRQAELPDALSSAIAGPTFIMVRHR